MINYLHKVPLVCVFIHSAISAPVSSLSLPALTLPTNLTGESNGNCASTVKFPSWSASDWHIHDCWQAVNRLYIKEVWNRPEKEFEFVAKGASAVRPHLGPQRTPRKYTVGSCVLTVMMLSYFTPRELPNSAFRQVLQSDESTYRRIYDAAKGIEMQCTQSRNPGWAQIGDNAAIGVFIWATNSRMNQITPGFDVLSSTLSANSSGMTSAHELW